MRPTKEIFDALKASGVWLRVVGDTAQWQGTHYDEAALLKLRALGFEIVRCEPNSGRG